MQVHVPIEEFLDWLQGFVLGFCAFLVHIITTGQMRGCLMGRTGSLYGRHSDQSDIFFYLFFFFSPLVE